MREQVTCFCSIYPFPHRLTGGKCNGIEWAESYYLNYKNNDCQNCNSNNETKCEVAMGQEDIDHCEAYNNQLNRQTLDLPINFEDL